jgi:integrase
MDRTPQTSARLSKHVADGALPQAVRYTIWDDSLTGFGLRVTPTGSRSWVVKYRAGGGRNAPVRWLTLGPFPKLSAQDARKEAARALSSAQLGHDPAGDASAKRREMTIGQLVNLYEEEGLVVQRGARIGSPMKPLTARYTMARLRHHVVPLLGSRRVTEVTEGDVETFARAVAKGATAKDEKGGKRSRIIVKGGEGAARKVVRDLSAVFAFAQRRRLVPANPVATASVRKTDNKRERFLSIAEVQRLGAALDELEVEGINRKAVDIARLWALTGCRRNEIASLRWSEIDFERGLLIFEDSKTGRSVRPLGAAAAALLESVRARSIAEGERSTQEAHPGDSPYVFPAERGSGFYQGTKKVWPVAIKRANLPGVTPHVLRHSLGSAAASAGEALLMVGSLLGHSNVQSTARYAHVARDPARLAADRATAGIAAALGRSVPVVTAPEPDEPASNVVPLIAVG